MACGGGAFGIASITVGNDVAQVAGDETEISNTLPMSDTRCHRRIALLERFYMFLEEALQNAGGAVRNRRNRAGFRIPLPR